jgi:hypothetical protein
MTSLQLPLSGWVENFRKDTGASDSLARIYLDFYQVEGLLTKDQYSEAIDAYRTDNP